MQRNDSTYTYTINLREIDPTSSKCWWDNLQSIQILWLTHDTTCKINTQIACWIQQSEMVPSHGFFFEMRQSPMWSCEELRWWRREAMRSKVCRVDFLRNNKVLFFQETSSTGLFKRKCGKSIENPWKIHGKPRIQTPLRKSSSEVQRGDFYGAIHHVWRKKRSMDYFQISIPWISMPS